jgi:L,D-peptidoglycan transpeptidase YkuD (ErfK/YbiS/YcfS/YnhG family)
VKWRLTFLFILGALVRVPSQALERESSVFENSRQLVVVTSAGWPDTQGTLHRFVRKSPAHTWEPVAGVVPVILGRGGLRWGRGLHQPPIGALMKREGDGASPAGIFELGFAFGEVAPPKLRWPWQQMTAAHAGVDDPKSDYYNLIVDTRLVKPDWKSAEVMTPKSGVYRHGIVIAHNAKRRQGAGSCIFFHLLSPRREPTAGCTALAERDLIVLMQWLHPAKKPLLIQLPDREYLALPDSWRLPKLPSAAP